MQSKKSLLTLLLTGGWLPIRKDPLPLQLQRNEQPTDKYLDREFVMGIIRNAMLAGAVGVAAAMVAVPAANAATYGLTIWQTASCIGNTSCANAVTSTPGTFTNSNFATEVASGTYTSAPDGSLAFNYPGAPTASNNIGTFLLDGTGSASVSYISPASAASTLSTNSALGAGVQTAFNLTGTLSGPASISITHDDGIAFYLQNPTTLVWSLVSPASAEGPTAAELTTFSTLTGGNFQLIYVASNGLPEVLDFVATVPVPASVWLFGAALGGLGLLMRRRRNGGLAFTA